MVFVAYLLALFLPGKTAQAENLLYSGESNYYTVRVVDNIDLAYGTGRMLFLDMDSHNFAAKEGDYRKIYTDIAPLFSHLLPEIHTVYFLGGGAYLMPGEFAMLHPETHTIVAEIDPKVTEIAERYFDLNPQTLTSVAEDGRVYLHENGDIYDIIMNDGFNTLVSMPFHLMTREFDLLVQKHLSDNGIYVTNVIGPGEGPEAALFRSFLITLSGVFPNYEVVTFGKHPTDVQNILVFASKNPLFPLGQLLSQAIDKELNISTLSAHIFPKEELYFSKGILLTDDFAPVEILNIPALEKFFPLHVQLQKKIFPNGYRLQ